ncbi:LINE-1 reverse transcriptase like protein, partial [Nosema granulosis]
LVYDFSEKLNVWNSHFKALSYDVVSSEVYAIKIVECEIDEVSVEELRAAVKACGNNKAAGNDCIPSELLRVLVKEDEINEFTGFVVNEFNRLMSGEDFVDAWCETDVIALFKKGNVNDVNNYRGIALVNTILKLFLKIVNERLSAEIEEKRIISKYQAGFRKGEEGMQHVASLLEIVKRREFDGKDTFLRFIDFEKAYDNVTHDILFEKLQKVGVSTYLVNVLKNLYKKTFMRVKLGDQRSEGFEYKKGVRQGCPCSPMLFNIFINDILDEVCGVNIPNTGLKVPGLMFADDVVLFGESYEDICLKIEKVCTWTTVNKMRINANKCGILVWNCLENAGNRVMLSVSTPFGTIEEVNSYKYLGISIQKRLMEEEIVREAGRKGTMLLGMLKGKFLNKYVSLFFKSILIRSVLIPTMLYGRELWGMSSARANIIRNRVWKAYKLIFGFKNVAYDSVSDEFGIERIDIQACKSRVRAIRKYRLSKTVIADIIICPVRNRRTTWSSRSERWIKRYLCLSLPEVYGLQLFDLYETIKEVYVRRKSYARSASSRFRENLKLSNLNFKSLLVEVKAADLYKFVLVRIGRIVWTNELVSRNMIIDRYKDHCILCLEHVRETTKHFVLEYVYLRSVREEFKLQIDKLKEVSSSANQLLSYVLGSRTNALSIEEESFILRDMIKMISRMLLIRSIRVSNEASMVPT